MHDFPQPPNVNQVPLPALRYTFRKAERLCSRRLIEPLFQHGKAFNTYPLRFVFARAEAGTLVCAPATAGPLPQQVLLSVSKRLFKRAHDRNRIKRLLREAWRHGKSQLPPGPASANLLIAVLYIGREMPASLPFLTRKLRKGLTRLAAELPAAPPPSAS